MSRDADQPVSRELLVARLRSALALRERYCGGGHYRLVYGESDGLPGLVVDRFGDVLVGQIATLAMEQRRGLLEEVLREVVQPRVIAWKNDTGARDLEGLPHELRCDAGELPPSLQVVEAGVHFTAPLATGQKTGWFYDQTANRKLLRGLLKPGAERARCMQLCGWLGGLGTGGGSGLGLVRGFLRHCTRSRQRQRCQQQPATRNTQGRCLRCAHRAALPRDAASMCWWSIRRHSSSVARICPKGEVAYRKLNQLALQLASDEALLVSCSCSWHLPAERLPELLNSAAGHAGRNLAIIAQGGQSPDHPVHPAMPRRATSRPCSRAFRS